MGARVIKIEMDGFIAYTVPVVNCAESRSFSNRNNRVAKDTTAVSILIPSMENMYVRLAV